MSKFIEEFYYGNIDPQARSTKQNKTVQKQMEVLMLNEEFLTEALTGENKKKFLDFVNAWSIQQHICDILEGGEIAFEKRKNKYRI